MRWSSRVERVLCRAFGRSPLLRHAMRGWARLGALRLSLALASAIEVEEQVAALWPDIEGLVRAWAFDHGLGGRADDLVGAVGARVARSMRRWDPSLGSLRRYLVASAYNEMREWGRGGEGDCMGWTLRGGRGDAATAGDSLDAVVDPRSQAPRLDSLEEARALLSPFDALTREVVSLHLGFDGPPMSLKEVGKRVGRCENWCRLVERRAFSRMRAMVRGVNPWCDPKFRPEIRGEHRVRRGARVDRMIASGRAWWARIARSAGRR